MTIKTELEAEKVALQARMTAIDAELTKGESWLEAEWQDLETWIKTKKAALFPAAVPEQPAA